LSAVQPSSVSRGRFKMNRRLSRLTSKDPVTSEQERDMEFIRSVVKLQRVQRPVKSPPPMRHALRAPAAGVPLSYAACLQAAHPFFAQAYRLSSYVYRHFGPELFVDSKGISSSAPLWHSPGEPGLGFAPLPRQPAPVIGSS